MTRGRTDKNLNVNNGPVTLGKLALAAIFSTVKTEKRVKFLVEFE